MVESSMYLSDETKLGQILHLTGLSPDELEIIVGRFRKTHYRFAGKLRGEYIRYIDGKQILRHHFTKKILWED